MNRLKKYIFLGLFVLSICFRIECAYATTMKNVPNTSDQTNLGLYIALSILAFIIMIVVGIIMFGGKKDKNVDESKEFNYVVNGDGEENQGITLKKDEADDDDSNSTKLKIED